MSSPTLFGFTDHDMKNSIDEQDKKRVNRDSGEERRQEVNTNRMRRECIPHKTYIQIQSSHSLLRQEVEKSVAFNYTS